MVNPQHGFSEGNLVRLKDGGPLMSVKFAIGVLLLCVWTDPGGRARRGTFSHHQLELVTDAELLWVRVAARLASRWHVVAASC
ncbi:DUF2158 domain-containing protein [Ramlibacter ginsenosidimutans]|uniref:DUF2158 domain-containing protein n=1 Tax=Ramlibacter ginsenosidimutans TaxID=502333 RepID=A0A934TW25_9BURK|nr:DUF2158 domain-containing protein [Ramlibacter ginsenosidimutans]